MKLVSAARRLSLLLAASALIAGPAVAQSYDGDWGGTLKAGGQDLRLVLHIKTQGGETSAILDSLDQGSTIPATAVKTEGGELSVLFLNIGGELKAKIAADGKTLVGTWEQGASLPVTLTKQPAGAK